MEINATQKLVIDIDANEQKRICQNTLYKNFDWKEGYYINDKGWVCELVNANTTHSFELKNEIRKADDNDRCIEHILKFL